MKKILIALLLTTNACFASTSEFFSGMDENALKAGISKYILTKGGVISHGDSYDSNVIQAMETVTVNKVQYRYNYIFKLIKEDGGTNLVLTVLESSYGSAPAQAGADVEQKVMNVIKSSIKERLLYGLGFDFATYYENGKAYKAPKGKETGIVLTVTKYDAQKQGLMAGDVIIAINGVQTKDIPIEEYTSILNAKTMSDMLELTCKRGKNTFKVNIKPRLSNNRVF